MNTTLFGTAAYPLASAARPPGATAPASSPTSTLFDALDVLGEEDKVSISEQGKAKQQSMLSSLSLLQQTQAAVQSQGSALRKSAARAKIEMLKKQMDMLRSMLAGLDPRMAKALLGQLKQIAQELKQAAAVLGENDGGGSGFSASQSAALPVSVPTVTAPAGDGTTGAGADDGQADAAAQQAQQAQQAAQQLAEQQASDAQEDGAGESSAATPPSTRQAEAEATALAGKVEQQQQGKQASPAGQGGDADQRGNDAELIRSAVRRLKLLLSAVKSQLKNNDDLKKTQQQIQAAENIAEQLATGGDAALAGSVDGGAVSISAQA